ncbi:MAG: serine hydrolase [Gammaproteobacteria bacterium HGW-Gammaproteobacteria-4]|jgi:CubicO group peptidase (beta-lactamase class C family)|nr:MAG: serine hydrolase [Gammaproteobacteria bacterium HGW-Gammaproteobacteria-4]
MNQTLRHTRWLLTASLLVLVALAPAWAADYVPPAGKWKHKAPAALGFEPQALAAAVAYAKDKAVVAPSDMHQVLLDSYVAREPNYRVLGPTRDRVGSAGLVIRHGYIAAQWGDIERADMTFSAVKSYLSTVVGVAIADGRIKDVHDLVSRYVSDGRFTGEHNGAITWQHLLQQTSDWQGSLFDTPDWADRPEGATPADWPNRPLSAPGTRFKYNDVRVNLLAYATLQVLKRPLPEVLQQRIMGPIGASTSWSWHGYRNSIVPIDGKPVESVSGGGHFGGGLFISALDHARFGLLMLRNGRWGERQVIAPDWLAQARTPSSANPEYGYLWWLNTDRKAIPAAPESAFWAAGFGGHYVYVDQANDLVVVLRWVPDLAGVITKVLAAMP